MGLLTVLRRAGWPVILAAAILLLFIAVAILGSSLAKHDPLEINIARQLEPPSWEHPFGTDAVGRDVLARVIAASRVDLGIAIGSVTVALLVGVSIGMIAGYAGGWVDDIIMRVVDIIQSFPAFILALSIVAVFGHSIPNLIAVIGFVYTAPYARIMRTQVAAEKSRQYVEAAVLAGNSHLRILARHLLPNTITSALVLATLNLGWAILSVAGLSFLGVGVRPPEPEWGQMIAGGMGDLVAGYWWPSIFPGLVLFVFVFACNVLGETAQRQLDPR